MLAVFQTSDFLRRSEPAKSPQEVGLVFTSPMPKVLGENKLGDRNHPAQECWIDVQAYTPKNTHVIFKNIKSYKYVWFLFHISVWWVINLVFCSTFAQLELPFWGKTRDLVALKEHVLWIINSCSIGDEDLILNKRILAHPCNGYINPLLLDWWPSRTTVPLTVA